MSTVSGGWTFVAIGVGASLGAWLRWGLGVMFNPLLPSLPLGTLVANLLGGLLMGGALGLIQSQPAISPLLKLMLTTGFLGGLTTFSTFSAEGLHLLQRGAWGWLILHSTAHVVGALLMVWMGYVLMTTVLRP